MKMARLAQILAQPVLCPRIANENYLRRARLTLRRFGQVTLNQRVTARLSLLTSDLRIVILFSLRAEQVAVTHFRCT